MANSTTGYGGAGNETDGATHFSAISFLIETMMNGRASATIVKVMACTNAGGISAVGFVDIMPMVNQIDGDGDATPHGTIYHVPYVRIQGGANAVIIDPQVGDKGIAIFAHNDISSVKATKQQSNPPTFRRGDWADAMYIGGLLNGEPTQTVAFMSDRIQIVSNLMIDLRAPVIQFVSPSLLFNPPSPT